ncbi:MAG TPA: SRPBCC domain-containing protein [Candidatus Paceibacterota bacterium]|nr:SRPBCC domain-containing protein [Candidatus Paceibacterota bacterium]
MTRTFNAPVEDVFNTWVDPKLAEKWHGPEGFTNTIHEFDAREGGSYRLTMHAPNGETHPLRGVFKEIKRPTRLVMTWQWEQGGPDGAMGKETLVTVEFKDRGGKTEMVFEHSGFANDEIKGMHEHGWSGSWSRLANIVE